MRCPRCLALVREGAELCDHCHEPLLGASSVPAGQQSTAPVLPAGPSSPAPAAPAAGRLQARKSRGLVMGLLALLAALLFKGKVIFLGLFKLKSLLVLAKSGGSMLLMIWVYAMVWPVSFAVGFAVLLLVHELGHALALRALGIPFSAPIFIPFLGALIGLKKMPPDAGKEALVAYAGPFVGTVGAQICLVLHNHTGHQVYLALAQIGFFLNLINLAPYSPLDGGRIVAAISPKIWLVALPLMLLGGLYFHSFILLLITALGIPRAISAWKQRNDPEKQAYFNVSRGVRLKAAAGYLALAAFLAYMMYHAGSIHAGLGAGAAGGTMEV